MTFLASSASQSPSATGSEEGRFKVGTLLSPEPGETVLVSVGLEGNSGQGDSLQASLSKNNRVSEHTEFLSVSTADVQGDDWSGDASISANGRYVVLNSQSSNLVEGDTNSVQDIFLYDREFGLTERISMRHNGEQTKRHSYSPHVSGNGRFVAFRSQDSKLIHGDSNKSSDGFLYDRVNGTIQRVTVGTDNVQGNWHDNVGLWVSHQGHYVAFGSVATNLAENDRNNLSDVFLRGLQP